MALMARAPDQPRTQTGTERASPPPVTNSYGAADDGYGVTTIDQALRA